MFGLIIYDEECTFVFYSIRFYGGKTGKQVPGCRVLLCLEPLRRSVLPAFYSLWRFVCLFVSPQ